MTNFKHYSNCFHFQEMEEDFLIAVPFFNNRKLSVDQKYVNIKYSNFFLRKPSDQTID